MKSLGIDYKTQPYRWIVTITPKGVFWKQRYERNTLDDVGELQPDEVKVLSYLVEGTETGAQEMATINQELSWNPAATRSCLKRLQSKGLITIRFMHDMESNLSD